MRSARSLARPTALAALVVGLVGLVPVHAQSAAERHAAAVARLEALGAQITYRDAPRGGGKIILATDGAWRGGDEGLALLDDVQGLYKLRLGGKITDAGLAHLAGLTELTSLDVHVLGITDDGVRHLAGLTGLERLNLTYSKVTDAGLRHLVGLEKLQWLGLAYTQVTKEGVEELQAVLGKTIIEGNFTRRKKAETPG